MMFSKWKSKGPQPVFLTLSLVFAAVGIASGQMLNRAGKPFPNVALPAVSAGANIVTSLGVNLQDVASWYGHTSDELTKLVRRDKDLRADKKAHLHYACSSLIPPAATAATYGTQTPAVPSYPLSQTFLLHSRPASTKKIYLDFNGFTTSGTVWNVSYTNGADIVTPPYDIDGNPATFSNQELANIQQIWQQVGEDYAPFDVDVTTEDPGVDALCMTSPSDLNFGKRVVIGGSSTDWAATSAGGIAYVGSFNWNVDTPVFVFSAQLSNGDPKDVGEACSHEVGHTFGLHHDGTTDGSEYFLGNATWAPIMGLGYYVNVVQWSKGEYPLANNQEDDVAIIAQMVGYAADDAGNDAAHAVLLAGTSPQAYGVISSTADLDNYAFNAGAGPVSFTLSGAAPSPDLCVQLTLRDSKGNTIATSTPGIGMGGSLAASVVTGSYSLEIKGAGLGDWTNGFGSYGSIGQYMLAGTLTSPGALPVAVVSNSSPLTGGAPLTVNFSSTGSYDSSGSIAAYLWDFGDGNTSTLASPAHAYSTTGIYVAKLTVTDTAGLIASASTTVTVKPAVPPVVAASASPLTGAAPLTVTFSSTGSSDPQGGVLTYLWTFGDGATATTASASHAYTVAGSYIPTLAVTNTAGLTASANTAAVTVAKPLLPPVAAASASPLTGTTPLTVVFSSTGSSDPQGGALTYLWTFGDGTTATTASPSHIFTTAGTYTPKLTVTNVAGLSTSASTSSVTVKAALPPVAKASASPLTGTTPLTVVFSSTGSSDPQGGALTYLWTFGDGTTATTASPSHIFTTAGTYTPKLTVTNVAGLSTSASTSSVTVKAALPPVAKASASPLTGKAPLTVTLSSTGSSDPQGGALTYLWTFGDGTTATTASPSHIFTTAGTYTPKLTVTNTAGLSTSASTSAVAVAAAPLPPTVKASATPASAFVSTAIAFSSAGTTDPQSSTLTYLWTFGDGTTSTTASPSKTYTTAGTYAVTMKATDALGATATATVSVLVAPKNVSAAGLTTTLVTVSSTSWGATTTVTVKDALGNLQGSAKATGTWSGVYSATGATATTGTSGTALGVATFTAPTSTKKGTYTFTLTGITLTGFTYDSTKNVKSSGTVSTP